jgi:type 1 glutamine amidotransferase
MRTCAWLIVLAGVAGLATAGDNKPAKKKLLVITESKGFRHGCVTRKGEELSVVEKVLTELGEKSGAFEATCSQDSRGEIKRERLEKFDAVFFYTTGELPISDTQKADLLDFVRSGKGFAGAHSASDTFYRWPGYFELLGAYFQSHPWHQLVNVIVEDKNHPATRHLGDSFKVTDEIYQFRQPVDRKSCHVLMRLDMDSVKGLGKRTDSDNALAWTREFGKGRVFYTALGHRDELWTMNEQFRQHILGGLKYVLKLEDAGDKQ